MKAPIMMLLLVSPLLASLALPPAAAAPAAGEPRFELRHPLDAKVVYEDYGGTVWWKSPTIKPDKARFIRLRFSGLSNPENEAAFIVVRDRKGKELQRLSLRDATPSASLVTMRFPVKEVTAYLEAPARPSSLRLTLSDYFTDTGRNPKPLSAMPAEQPWFNVADAAITPAIHDRARGVVNLLFTSDMVSCSGFLVAPGKVMTNTHCIESSSAFRLDRKSCGDVLIQLDYLSETKPPVSLHCRDARSYPDRDIAVLRVAPEDLEKLKGRPIVRFADANMPLPLNVEVIHHPAGLPMKLSRDCRVIDRGAASNLRHTCNTAGGSSGAPLFDAAGRVVGVQVEGFPDMSLQEYNMRTAKGEKFYNVAVDVKRLEPALKELDK